MSQIDIYSQKWIDIIFQSRDKAYGAYELRQNSSKDLGKAWIAASIFLIILIATPLVLSIINPHSKNQDNTFIEGDFIFLPPIDEPKAAPPPPSPPSKPLPPPKVNSIKFPPPVVVDDPKVYEEQVPTAEEFKITNPGQETVLLDEPSAEPVIVDPKDFGKTQITEDKTGGEPYIVVEVYPEFHGGLTAMYKYIYKNIKYPIIAKERRVQGKVFLSFIVERDGSISNVEVLRGIGSGCDKEAVRVIKNMPKWKPGIQNGQTVRVRYSIPITYRLQN